ncbi:ABC transporter ATP-binding protein, partial [Candidatus Saccharibacteria bacterium]|nr:ABC transporter ATP-binding protein [Candidatus Saccharibacteria bacterium]
MVTDAGIVIDKLSKRYSGSDRYALRDLSLTVEPGEVYGFLGPNGAGKSTTIRTLMGFLGPTKGSASIVGLDVVRDSVQVKRHVGYLSGDMAIYPKLTGREYLDYMSQLQAPASMAYRQELTKRLQCTTTKRVGELSRGNRQKIALVQAFMSQPSVLILDEPTSGLDPLMQDVFYELVREARQRGTSVFMSSHILGEVQKVCDRFGVLRAGKLVAEQSLDDMASQAAQTFDVMFAGAAPIAKLKKIPGLKIARHDGQTVSFHMNGELTALFALLAQYPVTHIDTQEINLEDLFRHYYQ